jgi:hypothetical protein
MSAKILYTDIETSPILAHIWSLRDLNVGLNQIIQDPEVIGVGYRWNDQRGAKYVSTWDHEDLGGRAFMLGTVHALLDEADVVVHYNGDRFDIPWLNGEFARIGLTPPSPFKNIDLYKVARKNFRFPSYKLQYVSTALGLAGKHQTGGHGLWVACLNGDEKARAKMARYCKQDVNLLPDLLEKLRPWLGAQVNFALWSEQGAELACQKCGKAEFLRPKGTAYTATMAYPQYLCCPDRGGCGGWTRDKKSAGTTAGTGVQR